MSVADRISRGVKATLGANVLNVAANGLLIVVLTRYLLTPDEYGLLYYAISILTVVAMFGTLGFPSSLARYIAEYAETDPTQIPHILRVAFGALLAFSIGVGAIASILSPVIADRLGEPSLAPLLALALGYVLLQSIRKYLGKAFQGFNRVDYSALINATNAVGRVVFTIGFVVLGFGVVGAFVGYLAGFLVASLLGFVLLYRNFYRQYDASPSREPGLRRRILEYSVPLTATRGALVLDKHVDTILVGFFLTPAAVSFYTIAKQVSDMVITPAQAFGFTVSPTYGEQQAADRPERAARLYIQSLRGVLLLYIPAVVGLILVAEPMVKHVFGPDYLGAVPVLQVISLYILANAINRVTSDGLDFLGRARARAIVKSLTAVANLLLNLLMIPMFGVVGAAYATVITYSIYAGANVTIIGRELPIGFSQLYRPVVSVSAVSVVMGVCVFVLVPYISGIVTLLGVVTVGIVVWGVLASVGGVLDVRKAVAFFS